MPDRDLRLQAGDTFSDRASQTVGAAVILAWILLLAAQEPRAPFTSRFECGSDPWDFLHVGEMLEPSSLGFIVESHCANARYSPDGWIELSYGGGRVDVELRRIDVAGTTYLQVVSIGGDASL
jgi:hypothetical protein